MEHAQLVLGKGADDRVEHTAVVEQDQVAFFPILSICQLLDQLSSLRQYGAAHLWGDTRTLDAV